MKASGFCHPALELPMSGASNSFSHYLVLVIPRKAENPGSNIEFTTKLSHLFKPLWRKEGFLAVLRNPKK